MQIKYLFLLLSLVFFKVSLFASNIKDTMSVGFNTYVDNGDVQVYSPTLSLFKKVSHNWMLGFKMRIDAITAASITNGSGSGHVDVVTGASKKEGQLFDDVRYAPTLIATYDDGINTLSFGGYISEELDYSGKSLFANYVRQLNAQNTALGVGISQSFDKWKPIFNRALPTNKREEGKIDISINQLITPKFSIQGVYSYMKGTGFLASPYHYILQNDIAKFENYPESRVGQAYALKGVYMLGKDDAINASYRYYKDDWDITSHTINVEELHDYSRSFTSGLRVRYYTQSKSNFIKDIGTYTLNDKYYAVDYRMSAFDSFDVGVPFIYRMRKGDKVSASIDYYQTTNNDYIKHWYGVSHLSALYTTLTYEFGY